jgi:hypothetical protein
MITSNSAKLGREPRGATLDASEQQKSIVMGGCQRNRDPERDEESPAPLESSAEALPASFAVTIPVYHESHLFDQGERGSGNLLCTYVAVLRLVPSESAVPIEVVFVGPQGEAPS